MKKATLLLLFIGLMGFWNTSKAQITDGHEALKKHLNSVVEQVKETPDTEQKRAVLNESLDEMMTAIERVNKKKSVSEDEKETLAEFKNLLSERKDELNGSGGYAKVPANQLNHYAQFIQQDVEQADSVLTISATTALLIVIILLLL